jgi:hypothetical protein
LECPIRIFDDAYGAICQDREAMNRHLEEMPGKVGIFLRELTLWRGMESHERERWRGGGREHTCSWCNDWKPLRSLRRLFSTPVSGDMKEISRMNSVS